MKRVVKALVILVFAFNLVGCSAFKKDEVTMCGLHLDLQQLGIEGSVTSKIQVTHKNGIVSAVNGVETTFVVDDEARKQLHDMALELKSKFEGLEHFNLEIAIVDKSIIVTTDADYLQVDVEELKKIDFTITALFNDDNELVLENLYQMYEQIGMECEGPEEN